MPFNPAFKFLQPCAYAVCDYLGITPRSKNGVVYMCHIDEAIFRKYRAVSICTDPYISDYYILVFNPMYIVVLVPHHIYLMSASKDIIIDTDPQSYDNIAVTSYTFILGERYKPTT